MLHRRNDPLSHPGHDGRMTKVWEGETTKQTESKEAKRDFKKALPAHGRCQFFCGFRSSNGRRLCEQGHQAYNSTGGVTLMIRLQELLRTWPLRKHTSDRLSEAAARRLLSEDLTPTAEPRPDDLRCCTEAWVPPHHMPRLTAPRRLVPLARRLILF